MYGKEKGKEKAANQNWKSSTAVREQKNPIDTL